MTNILFVHFGLDWIRGSERALLDLIAGLDRSRFSPVLWCNAEIMAEEARQFDLPIYRDRFTILFDYASPRFDVANWARLVREGGRLVRRHDVSLLHSNSAAPIQWLLPVARTHRVPLLGHLHTLYEPRDRVTMGMSHVSMLVANSAAVARGSLEDGVEPGRIRVVPCGVDFDRLALGAADASARTALGAGPDVVVLASIGSLIHRKGFDVLLRALKLLGGNRPAVHLLIVGDGPDRGSLEQLARELGLEQRVRFLGVRTDIGPLLRGSADLLVSAARSEAFGLTFIEAGACGLAVVGTGVDGVPEVVRHEDTGLLVAPESPEALAGAIGRLARDPEERRLMGLRGRARAEQEFSIARYVAEFAKIYDELAANDRYALGWFRGWGSVKGALRWSAGAVPHLWRSGKRRPLP